LCKTMVKGKRLNTDAFPALNNFRAMAGLQGVNGFRLLSTTRTKFWLDI